MSDKPFVLEQGRAIVLPAGWKPANPRPSYEEMFGIKNIMRIVFEYPEPGRGPVTANVTYRESDCDEVETFHQADDGTWKRIGA